jgi:hypothetical protein
MWRISYLRRSTGHFRKCAAFAVPMFCLVLFGRVVDPYSFFTDPDPDLELDVGGQYGSVSKSGSGSNTDPGL